ncbi:MAG: alpha/beta fold family hydrolase [Herbinix sp.]|jgi:esterase/lipase|nr:alpha/beta fold family hydrolase [Herbinix sp.]
MIKESIIINNIPSILWGEKSDKLYLFVHGKMSNKESAEAFAEIANARGYQVLSFDLPAHGDRQDFNYRCDIWNGIHDLNVIGDYARHNWNYLSLYGCSLGAYFSLHAYQDIHFDQCLLQSPILDMEYLIHNMFLWFDVTEERLEQEKEIPTPIDILTWDYYCYVKSHPIDKWLSPTCILFGSLDQLQNRSIMEFFAQKFRCSLTVSEGCDHPFASDKEGEIVTQWIIKHLDPI